MLPPKDQPSAPKKAKKTAFSCQSSRPDSKTAATVASTPGIIAPYSCPKFPRMPQPMERESPTKRMGHRFAGFEHASGMSHVDLKIRFPAASTAAQQVYAF